MYDLESLEELDSYLNIVIGKDAGILFLCVFGAVLNSVMLYMLLSKKQIRSSVHTVYMIQIALTDLLVCMMWLVLTSVITSNLLQMRRDAEAYENTLVINNDSNLSEVYAAAVSKDESSPAQYRSWRIMYTWYNFHYYTNILLLASMSVERCAAVWKSMRCQRYQYNRKIIIGISVFMWIVAFCFVLPDLVNPDLMVSDSDFPDSVSRIVASEAQLPSVGPNEWGSKPPEETLNEIFDGRKPVDIVVDGAERGGVPGEDFLARPYENEEKNYQKDMDILFACYLLWARALHNGEDVVKDHERVTVHGCMIEFFAITTEYGNNSTGNSGPYPDFPEISGDFPDGFPSYFPGDIGIPPSEETVETESSLGDYGTHYDDYEMTDLSRDIEMYSGLLIDALKALMNHHRSFRMGRHEACDPDLSDAARIYVLVVNLVLGFFVPFSIIVFSYVSIAYMIGKRARSRMNPSVSETSTTHFAQNYIQNPSSTNAQTAIRLRDKNSRNRPDSVGRRMSDFMRNLVLRKPQDGAESRSYFTDSDREGTPFGSMQKMRYSSASRRYEDSSSANAKSDNPAQYKSQPKSPDNDSEEDPLYDPELQEAIRQLNSVRMRNPENPRIKKYSFGHDTANENIPQTIEEHPHEIEAETEDDRFLTASNGSCPNDATPPGMRNHAALLMVQRNSRRESGGSYGSSMDSMATDQTSLMTSHHDKRCSGATTLSALTPPTPIEPSNPNSNQFFPTSEERLAAHNRSHSAEAGYPLLADDQQRSPRPQKPGSQLNDITLQLYRKSLQKKHTDDGEFDNLPRRNENDLESANQGPGTSGQIYNPRERYSYPRMSQGKSSPEDRLSSSRLSTRSTARLINEPQRSSHGEERETKQNSTQPKYNRLNSSTSTVHYNRGRTYSTTSKGSTGVSTLRKTMVRKNAERHLRVSRTVLAYVIVFSICWLPQRITYLLYVIEALKGASNAVCTKLIASVRIVSFISVLLNPAVYILTQRDFQTYVRNSICVSRLRRWYAKCSKKRSNHRESNTESRGRVASSDRNDDIELQERRLPEDREQYGYNNRQINNGGGRSPPYRMASPTRANVRKSPNGLQHEMFPPPTGINARQRDATIDELKEEEAAAEESLEKEMERLAAEEEKRRQDDINKNFLESSEDDVISAKNTTGSGNKTTSSSSKSETFEEFWKRWLESGGAQLLSSPNGNMTSPDVPTQMEPRFPDLEELAKVSAPSGTNNPQQVLQ